jgi:hypothetical protein
MISQTQHSLSRFYSSIVQPRVVAGCLSAVTCLDAYGVYAAWCNSTGTVAASMKDFVCFITPRCFVRVRKRIAVQGKSQRPVTWVLLLRPYSSKGVDAGFVLGYLADMGGWQLRETLIDHCGLYEETAVQSDGTDAR